MAYGLYIYIYIFVSISMPLPKKLVSPLYPVCRLPLHFNCLGGAAWAPPINRKSLLSCSCFERQDADVVLSPHPAPRGVCTPQIRKSLFRCTYTLIAYCILPSSRIPFKHLSLAILLNVSNNNNKYNKSDSACLVRR